MHFHYTNAHHQCMYNVNLYVLISLFTRNNDITRLWRDNYLGTTNRYLVLTGNFFFFMFQKRKSGILNFEIILVKVTNLLTINKCKYWTPPPPLPLGITREKNPFYNLQGKLQVFIFSFNVLVWMVMTPFERDKWPMGPFSTFKRWEGEGVSIPSLFIIDV